MAQALLFFRFFGTIIDTWFLLDLWISAGPFEEERKRRKWKVNTCRQVEVVQEMWGAWVGVEREEETKRERWEIEI